MAFSPRNVSRIRQWAALLALSLVPALVLGDTSASTRIAALGKNSIPAASKDARKLPIDVASSKVDYKGDTVEFKDVVITQGDTKVQADRAHATGLDNFDNSHWTFEGNVRINGEQHGSLHSDQAVVEFRNKYISKATATGSPAEFEQKRSDSDETARGHAHEIVYNVNEGTVRLSNDAWLSDGHNEISGKELIYNIREQRVAGGSRTGRRRPGAHQNRSAGKPGLQPESMTSLRAIGLAKSYRSRQVVRDLSIEVANGEVVGLLGPNGAGKTTAFYMIVGLVPCDAGRIHLGDTDLTTLPMHKARAARPWVICRRRHPYSAGFPSRTMCWRSWRPARIWIAPPASSDSKSCWRNCASGTCVAVPASRCPEESGGAWKSHGHWLPSRVSCCWMSRLPVLTLFRFSISNASSGSSPAGTSACSSRTIMSGKPSASAAARTSSIRGP